MTKATLLSKLTAANGRPVLIMYDEDEYMYGGAEDHWLLTDDTGIYEVYINSNALGIPAYTQNIVPFIVKFVEYDRVVDVRVFTEGKDIASLIPSAPTMVYGGKTIAEVKAAIAGHTVNSSISARGYSTENDLNKVYGKSGRIEIDLTGGTGVVNNFGN